MDEQAVAKYGRHLSEKMLRLFDEALSQEKFCSLREDWELSEVEPGDIVHITGVVILLLSLCFTSVCGPKPIEPPLLHDLTLKCQMNVACTMLNANKHIWLKAELQNTHYITSYSKITALCI